MSRPESDFDTTKYGERLLAFAREYRELHPNAKLSEVVDSMASQSDLQKRSYEQNGKRSLESLPRI